MIAQAVLSVEPFGVRVLPPDGARRSAIHRHTGTAKFGDVERVPGRLLYRHVSRYRRDGAHVNIPGAQCHDQRNRVVRRRIGVDQEVSGQRLSVSFGAAATWLRMGVTTLTKRLIRGDTQVNLNWGPKDWRVTNSIQTSPVPLPRKLRSPPI